MDIRHLMRMSRWARHPPSKRRMVIYGVAITLSLMIAGLDRLGVFPDWMQVEPQRRMGLPTISKP